MERAAHCCSRVEFRDESSGGWQEACLSEPVAFVVLQQGSMPADPHSKPHDFLLTKEGLWLPLFAFIRLSTQERDQLCIFSTAAEAVQQVEDLVGPAIIDAERTARALPIELPPTPPDEPDASV